MDNSKNKLVIGIDLYNLSARPDGILRTGIQQVVFHLLKSQYLYRTRKNDDEVEIIPLPMLPGKPENSRFDNLTPSHDNPTEIVLEMTEGELNVPAEILWARQSTGRDRNWSQRDFYEVTAGLDWIVFTALSDFRFIVEQVKRRRPQVKVALLVHDLIPHIFPETASEGMRYWFEHCYLSSIYHYADLIFTNSRHTAIDCRRHLPGYIGPNLPIVSVPIFSESPSITRQDVALRQEFIRHSAEPGNYFVCLGTVEPRKNILGAIRGFIRFLELFPGQSEGLRLLLVGAHGWGETAAQMEEILAKYGKVILPLGYVDKLEMESLLHESCGLLLPTRYEGFGMPIQFALNFNLPVVTCINSSLPESTGFKSYFVRPDDADGIALAIRCILCRNRSERKGFDLDEVRRQLDLKWLTLFSDWMDTLKKQSRSSTVSSGKVSDRKTALKTPGRRLRFSLQIDLTPYIKKDFSYIRTFLTALCQLREELAGQVELIFLPVLPRDPFFIPMVDFLPSLSKREFESMEKKLGISSPILWGWDFAGMGYEVGLEQFGRITEGSDWFLMTSFWDIRRVYRPLQRFSSSVKISHFLDWPQDLLKGQQKIAQEETLRSIWQYGSFICCDSQANAEVITNSLMPPDVKLPLGVTGAGLWELKDPEGALKTWRRYITLHISREKVAL
ncbi:MAG: glycosyltransferase [Oligoflexales bacterium]|nr:glycosyltransferase [Oligoflexales bacterium]